jgi:hypothetical protein
MDLSDDKVSQALAAVMEICWHKCTESSTCDKCDKYVDGWLLSGPVETIYKIKAQFSAFTPDDIWQWKSYMKKEMPGEWERHLSIEWTKYQTETESFNAQHDPHNLVRYLYDNLEDWGYEECEHYAVNCGGSNACKAGFVYPECENGNILTERAKRFKTIVEGETK